ncbi:phosphoglycolate phosphatase-like HAD superfamily hydrolase [Comamonas sp. BIGb0152]|uniref:HAD family hydrolase n=1 Tax=Comamonas sp. BIGb0152 TaxID=2940601 RepID=UPI002169EF13|nr:HAD family hydrolase [Comamonas sp. BIGb0152]MCS4293239.1 phosphoglycolate phosphatase-like HAD superfamily hydrolase [Comamonas sp. BIGb0152]
MSRNRVLALDADGVLLDYNLAYAGAWKRTFGRQPGLRNPNAYWAADRWEVERLSDEALHRFRAGFDAQFWSALPAMPGALAACQQLVAAGFELVCLTALQPQFAQARLGNLRAHGFPIERVIATGRDARGGSPKTAALLQLQPLALVDDYLPNFDGLPEGIHSALVLREPDGSPNCGPALRQLHSTHASLDAFAHWWLAGRQEN